MDHGRGHSPRLRAVVLDDRDPRQGVSLRWPVVDLDALEYAGQVSLPELVGLAGRGPAGEPCPPGEADLPGVLQGVQIHDGPPQGHTLSRIAIIQDHGAKTWAVTAAVVHPGIGLSAAPDRHRQGAGLSELLDLCLLYTSPSPRD